MKVAAHSFIAFKQPLIKMKKFLNFSCVALVAAAVFFSTTNVDQTSKVEFASLTTLNSANAECTSNPYGANTGTCVLDWGTGESRCWAGGFLNCYWGY